MRNKKWPAIIAAVTVLVSGAAEADEMPLTHWGILAGGNFTWFITGVPTGGTPIFGELIAGPSFTIGRTFTFDVSVGVAFGGVTQNPITQPAAQYYTPIFLYFEGELLYGADGGRFGIQGITQFSLSTNTLFSESRLLVGPSLEVPIVSWFRVGAMAGYTSDWYTSNSIERGFGMITSLKILF